MRSGSGLTLVEVIVAMAILAVGILAVFMLQATSLRGTRTAAASQTLTNMAQSELQLQREFSRHVRSPVRGETCRSLADGDDRYDCEVRVFPCELVGGSLVCRNGDVATADARQVTVIVTARDGASAEVSTVVK